MPEWILREPPTLTPLPWPMTWVECWAVDDPLFGYTLYHRLYVATAASSAKVHTLRADGTPAETREELDFVVLTGDARETILASEIGAARAEAWSVSTSVIADLADPAQAEFLATILVKLRREAICHQRCFAQHKAAVSAGCRLTVPPARRQGAIAYATSPV